MKTLHYSIIAIVGIIVIIMTSVGVFMEKLGDNQQPYTSMTIAGIKENYTLNEPIAFSVILDGYGTGCGDTNATITKENDSKYKSPVWFSTASCASNTKFDNFKFNSLSGNTSINQAGNYALVVSFKGLTTHNHIEAERKFFVVPIESGQISNTSSNVSTIVIPKGSDDPSSGKNYEPRYLIVVLGVNNTVQWVNEADAPNTIVADTYNQPDPLSEKGPYSHGIIRPGKSSNFTFTKPGEFQYDTQPHPWLYGWVLVLPQSPENATQTVIVNNTKIPGPCEIFALPCPNSTIFTAQKFGSDIYIEKMTINGVDKYVIVHPLGHCVYPPSYRGYETCRNPDDLAILRLVGVDTSIPKENISIGISGLESSYTVGQPINFGISVLGYGHCDSPSVLVIHEGNIVWNGKSSQVSCPYPIQAISDRYIPTDFNGPFSLNQTGTYTIHVDYASNMTEKQFNVILPNDTSIFDTGITRMSANVTNTNFTVNYNIEHGQVSEIRLAKSSGALEILLHANGNGVITLDLPRALIDTKIHNQDEKFIVLEDGQEIEYREIYKTMLDRTLSIPFSQDASKIEIIGSYLI